MQKTIEGDTIIDMFRKKSILEYEPGLEIYPDVMTPAKKHIPEWYKKIPKWENNEIFTVETGLQKTIKQCIPFLDSLTTGYMITLPYDIYIKNNMGTPFVTWNDAELAPKWRNRVADLNLVPMGHYPVEYTWQPAVAFTVPIGYSMLFTHPLNRYDLPFTTLSGIIDGGLIMNHKGNVPFYVKKDFEGIIPQGTPIIQIIPFMQQSWSSKITKGLVKSGLIHNAKSTSVLSGWYKKTFWTRKKYD